MRTGIPSVAAALALLLALPPWASAQKPWREYPNYEGEWTYATERPPLTAEESVRARDMPGGTAPRRVVEQLAAAQAALAIARASVSAREVARAALMQPPGDVE